MLLQPWFLLIDNLILDQHPSFEKQGLGLHLPRLCLYSDFSLCFTKISYSGYFYILNKCKEQESLLFLFIKCGHTWMLHLKYCVQSCSQSDIMMQPTLLMKYIKNWKMSDYK